MTRVLRTYRWLFLLLAFSLLFADCAAIAEEAGLFSKLKAKASQKFDQFTDRDWLLTWGGGKVTGFLAGKAAGLIGMGLGMVLGGAIGGPAGVALGGYIGFRVADIVTKTFAKPLGQEMVRRKLNDEPLKFKDLLKSLDKKALTAESIGAVAGDLIGEFAGVALGLTLCAGLGPIALPLIGTFTGAMLGRKIGTWAGRGLGRLLGRKVAKVGYQALIGIDKPSVSTSSSPTAAPTTANPVGAPVAASPASVSAPKISAPPVQSKADRLHQEYQAAYKKYTDSHGDSSISADQRLALQKAYHQAYTQWLEALKGR